MKVTSDSPQKRKTNIFSDLLNDEEHSKPNIPLSKILVFF